jgi:DNA polymerase, archaea type
MLKEVKLDPNNELVLMSCFYDTNQNQLYLKMYNIKTEQLITLTDQSGFLPYTYFKTNDPCFNTNQLDSFLKENITKYEAQLTEMTDLLQDTEVEVLKLYSSNPYYVYENLTKKLNDDLQQHEYQIKIHESYMYDKQLIFSSIYHFANKTLYGFVPILNDNQEYFLDSILFKAHNASLISQLFTDEETSKSRQYQKYLESYTLLLNQPIPDFRRVAIDIEIWNTKNKFPDVNNPTDPIISVAFVDNRGRKNVVTTIEFLKSILATNTDSIIREVASDLMLHNHDFSFRETEEHLIKYIFKKINDYPFVITFNGDNFDLAYITARAERLGIDKEINPIIFKKEKFAKSRNSKFHKNPVLLKNSIHLDLFQLYQNISLQNYAFNARYKEYSLDAISQALLNKNKFDYNIMIQLEKIEKMFDRNKPIRYDTIVEKAMSSLSEMFRYNLHDAQLTMELTTFSNNLPMNLITILSRITKTAIEDICRYGISNWARNMLYFEHRKRNYIIPTGKDLARKGTIASVESIIKNKGFRGAFVLETKPGVWFNVTSLDLGSMYPSIIKSFNLSYETVNCIHSECQKGTVNRVVGTSHYICMRNHGLVSLLIGVIRDLRLGYFKKLGKQPKYNNYNADFYKTVDQAMKVFMNGTYGVLGSESFNMFCLPVAESVTAIGRHIITTIIDYAEKELNLNVILSDTDSIYTVDPTEDQIQKMIEFTRKKFSIDLEEDKQYKFLILSDRKKNYVGVTKSGIVDVKGLTGKKSNIPQYIKNCFNDILKELKEVENKKELDKSLANIKQIVKDYIYRLESKKDLDKNDLIFKIMINRDVDSYGKVKSIKTDMDGNEVIQKVGIPSQIKIALEMNKLDPNLDISQNSVISFIKTKDGYKLPSQIKNLREIDTSKYVDTLKTALEPILETLDIKFDDIIFKSRQLTTLDDMLGISRKIQN